MFVREDSGRAGGSALRHNTLCATIDCRNPAWIKAMIVVHHSSESASQRILWLLEELQAPLRGRILPARRAHQSGGVELREIHPLCRSPVITEGDRAIAESGAIIAYIVRRHYDGPRNAL